MPFATPVLRTGWACPAMRRRSPPTAWSTRSWKAEGRPTTDPTVALAGSMVPMGGDKGFALALLEGIEVPDQVRRDLERALGHPLEEGLPR